MIGRITAKYEVLEKLGEGGMGVVYKARDLELGRLVALKFLPSHLVRSPEQLKRFEREARTSSVLNHPNIATLYDMEQAGEERFLVIEYLPGGTLRARIHAGPLSTQEVIEYALQVARGLAHAHSSGIVHRDIKADNLMFSSEGRLKITDFGLARPQASQALTRSGDRLGTAAYMSPEQAQGIEVDHRSDIFSFGVVLYEMVTGRLPFQAAHEAALLYAIVNVAAPPARQLRPDVPAALEKIIEKTLEKDRDKRYQTMEAVIAELEAARSTPSVAARKPGESWLHRVAGRRAWLLAVCLLLLVVPLLLFLAAPRLGRLFNPLPAEKQLAILPFLNVGGEAANQAFCDGLVETLASKLSQLEQFHGSLWVVPTSEVRGRSVQSAEEARRAFGATVVLTGSIQRAGGRLRLIVNLVDARTLRQLRTLPIDTPPGDVAVLQDGIAARVAGMLEVGLLPRARRLLSAGGTRVPGAYEFYVQGQGYMARYDRKENLDSAIELFQKAIQRDPNYALAHAGLGEGYWRKYNSPSRHPRFLEEAGRSLNRAIALEDQIASAHATLGMVHNDAGQYDRAARELKRALEIDPASAEAHRGLADALEGMGRLQEAEATYRRAIELKPGYWAWYSNLGSYYVRHGRYEEAEPLFRRVIDLTPDNLIGYRNLGGTYVYMGRYEEAARVLEKAIAIQPTYGLYSNLGAAYYAQGRYDEAVRMYEKALGLNANDYRVWGNLADACRWAPQQRARAAEVYRRAIELAQQRLSVNPKDAPCRAALAAYWVKLGQKQRALAELQRARVLAPDDLMVQFKSAVIYELAGQRDRAREAVTTALRAGFSVHEVRSDPELTELRKDPRFQQWLADWAAESVARARQN